jgi:hypothetical protein
VSPPNCCPTVSRIPIRTSTSSQNQPSGTERDATALSPS